MKTYKIYDATYPLDATSSVAPDAYAIRGELVDDPPKGKKVGYVTMRDGSTIECYTKFNKMIVILPVVLIILAAACALIYLYFLQPKDVKVGSGEDSFILKQGSDNNVVTYNGFMALRDNSISVDFTNGAYTCTIQVVGEGIQSDPVTVEPNGYLASVPATFTTTSGVVNGSLIIKTDTSTSEQQVVVEIPDNNTENSVDTGLEGYWKGEYIYGTSTE